MAIAIQTEGMAGVSALNEHVDLLGFLQSQIVPELQDGNHTHRPVVKAAAIKFVATFRNQYGPQDCVGLMPLMITHLSSPVVVVHTFAAHAIERVLVTKTNDRKPKVGADDLRPFISGLFEGLFAIVDNTEWDENEYVMKCIMRVLATLRHEVAAVTDTVIQRLGAVLERVSKNPQRPQFNHYMFESLAVLVKSVCEAKPEAVSAFESFLQAPFSHILTQDIAEFTPYVFQIFAQLLEFRDPQAGLGDFFKSFFVMIKEPSNWKKQGNIPALCRLLKAYIEQAPNELCAPRELEGILGIFQQLMVIKSTEGQGFLVLRAVVSNFEASHLQPYLKDVFNVLLSRMARTKSSKFRPLFVSFLGLFVGKMGGRTLVDVLDSLQQGVADQIVQNVWADGVATGSTPTQRMDAKSQVVGITRFLFEDGAAQGLALLDKNPEAFAKLIFGAFSILSSDSFRDRVTTSGLEETDIVAVYDAQFSELVNARASSAKDPFPDRTAIDRDFMGGLSQLSQQRPGAIGPMLQAMGDPKFQQNVMALLQSTGAQLA